LLSALLVVGVRRTREPVYEGRPLSAWVTRWIHGSFAEEMEAFRILSSQVGPEALPMLIRMLKARDHPWLDALRQRVNAFWPGRFPPPPAAAELHAVAVELVKQLGPAGAPAAPALVALLDDDRRDGVLPAGEALIAVGEAAVPALLDGLRAPSPRVRSYAAWALDEILPTDRLAEALPGLLALAKSPASRARASAGWVLVRMAIELHDERARKAVEQLARDTDETVQRNVLERNVSFRPQTALAPATLRSLLEHPDGLVRLYAAESLWWTGHDRALALDTLTQLLREPQYIWAAALVLGRLGPDAASAIPALVEAVRREPVHRPDRIPADSAMALARFGVAALPGLRELLEDPALEVRFSAAQALRELGPAAASAVPGLLRLLRSGEPHAEIVASQALGAIGPAAAEAIPDLRRLAATRQGYPQAAAAEALAAIGVEERARLEMTTGTAAEPEVVAP
jgi:HEAT repeat protein